MALVSTTRCGLVSFPDAINLKSQQKRIRHLRGISMRNLHSGLVRRQNAITCYQAFFTLHSDRNLHAFYESEKITGSTNPSWKSFDISIFKDKINTSSRYIVVRVWVGQNESFHLLVEIDICFSKLHCLDAKVQQLLLRHTPNMVLFHMLDRIFVYVDKESPHIKGNIKKLNDFHLPTLMCPISIKVDQSSTRTSYTVSSVLRMMTVLRVIRQNEAQSGRYRLHIKNKLIRIGVDSAKQELREQMQSYVRKLRRELMQRSTHLFASNEQLHTAQHANHDQWVIGRSKMEAIGCNWEKFEADNGDYISKREQHVRQNALLNVRRRQMLSELFHYIYPISATGDRHFINGVQLPQAEELQGQDETMLAVGLGYTCHLTMKISQILGDPLRHPMDIRASRCVIYDQVSSKLSEKDREFQLCAKGKDKFHFNYAVFLLNKNISQLRFHCSMSTLDLRQTLQNLLTLLYKLGVNMHDGGNADASDAKASFTGTSSVFPTSGELCATRGQRDLSLSSLRYSLSLRTLRSDSHLEHRWNYPSKCSSPKAAFTEVEDVAMNGCDQSSDTLDAGSNPSGLAFYTCQRNLSEPSSLAEAEVQRHHHPFNDICQRVCMALGSSGENHDQHSRTDSILQDCGSLHQNFTCRSVTATNYQSLVSSSVIVQSSCHGDGHSCCHEDSQSSFHKKSDVSHCSQAGVCISSSKGYVGFDANEKWSSGRYTDVENGFKPLEGGSGVDGLMNCCSQAYTCDGKHSYLTECNLDPGEAITSCVFVAAEGDYSPRELGIFLDCSGSHDDVFTDPS